MMSILQRDTLAKNSDRKDEFGEAEEFLYQVQVIVVPWLVMVHGICTSEGVMYFRGRSLRKYIYTRGCTNSIHHDKPWYS